MPEPLVNGARILGSISGRKEVVDNLFVERHSDAEFTKFSQKCNSIISSMQSVKYDVNIQSKDTTTMYMNNIYDNKAYLDMHKYNMINVNDD